MRQIKMKNIMNFRLIGLASTIFAGASLVSCSNELTDPSTGLGNVDSNTVSLVKAPEVMAWSGNQVIGNNIATRAAKTITIGV